MSARGDSHGVYYPVVFSFYRQACVNPAVYRPLKINRAHAVWVGERVELSRQPAIVPAGIMRPGVLRRKNTVAVIVEVSKGKFDKRIVLEMYYPCLGCNDVSFIQGVDSCNLHFVHEARVHHLTN